ncbi:MAG: hypothetical protein L6R40_003091 [Gallowayella cf. fulva]|nr:MAG: hypothetical protein L6R40_003091 [Xanthomendoza cf. fulva]
MPTNRPFFANFLAAFRAHSALTASKTSTSPPSITNATPTSQFTLPSASAARTITTSPSPPQPTSQSPYSSTSPPTASQLKASTASPPTASSATTAALSAAAAGALSHRAHHASTSPPPRSPTNAPFTRIPQRRGSDSSSEGGFREVLGGEKWYIGGRTATGEERFYRMGIVRRERSWERRSFDQLSL